MTYCWEPPPNRTVKSFYHRASRTLVMRFAADGVPSCTYDVVTSMHAIYDEIIIAHRNGADIAHVLMSSEMPGIFNMGGELARMVMMARAGDRAGLIEYGQLSASLIHRTWNALGLPITTISAVDGDAFGGGCEAALSANLVVASKTSRFAFPEVRFGMFPGMGATSLIGRRISPAYATNMIMDARTIGAAEAASDGLVDRVVARHTEAAILRALSRMGERGQARLADIAALRRRSARYSIDEAIAVVMIWVDLVLSAPERSLAHMERIVKAQKSRLARNP